MNKRTTFVAAIAALAFTSGGVGAVAFGTAAAHAAPECSPATARTPRCTPPEGFPEGCDADGVCAQLWCPGSGMTGIPNWDMTVCHSFYFDPNAPLTKPVIIQGLPPGPPPPPRPPCIPFINCLPGL